MTTERRESARWISRWPALKKQFGKGAVIRMGERASRDIQVIPTGCLDLDMALGVGGLPRGRVV